MLRRFREFLLTIAAFFALVRGFFVKWFLPLHSEAGEEDAEPAESLPAPDDNELGYRGLLDFPSTDSAAPSDDEVEDAPRD